MSDTEPLTINETISGDPSPYAPKIPEDSYGIDFAVRPAKSPAGPTIALFISYRLGAPYVGIYGGRAGEAIHIVAVSDDTGRIYASPPMGVNSIPLSLSMADEQEIETRKGLPSATSSSLNVDLCGLLNLPAQAGQYHVFLWLDDLLSPIRAIHVPANDARPERTPLFPQRSAETLKFGEVPGSLETRAEGIALAGAAPTDSSIVYGRWQPDMDQGPTPEHDARPYYFSVMALSHRDRRFGWVSVNIAALPPGTNSSTFQFDLLGLVGPSLKPQKVFVLAMSRGVRSNMQVSQIPAGNPASTTKGH